MLNVGTEQGKRSRVNRRLTRVVDEDVIPNTILFSAIPKDILTYLSK